ncbi:hypothetical protein B9T19_02780 [Ignatzschineria sp. F8392]|uniref:RloB family protein n=1 Tax=Ignatzschineria sp. F8392 TaxID=1980117 RepID=UPI000B993345|nr:RloB family protein [Ignatzschineria sp. F8392]OYQ81609.1 hypothetical protein B9T19_02780 [Ignatzschineria sp. F8392]
MSRRARRGHHSRTLRKSIYLLVDGESEQAYLQGYNQEYLRRKNPQVNLSIQPKFFNNNLNGKEAELKKAMDDGHDYVFWLVDYDVILKEEREGANTKEKLQAINRKLQEQARKKGCQYEMLYMVPCLEFWFLLHFENTTKHFSNCSEVEKALKCHLPEYSKKPEWIKQHLINKLSSNFKEAIDRAMKLYHRPLADNEARADIGYFFNKLEKDFKINYAKR